jgi:hypothetical protein
MCKITKKIKIMNFKSEKGSWSVVVCGFNTSSQEAVTEGS